MLLAPSFLHAQETILASYQRSFMRAGLAAKTGILRDAVNDDRADEFIGEFYEFALRFIVENGDLLRDDPDMIILVSTAARGAGTSGHMASAETLWKVFLIFRDSRSRVEILRSLGVLGKDNSNIIENLNLFLLDQNKEYRSGMVPDYSVLEACSEALGLLGDSSSYTALFSAAAADYPPPLSGIIYRALESINGDLKQFLADVIRSNSAAEKVTALWIAVENRNFSNADKGELAEAALDAALILPQDASSSSLRYAAIGILSSLKWTRASPLAIRHFYLVRTDFENGKAPRERFIEAINCLGAMGDSESAQAIALQLGYFTSRFDHGGAYDEAVIIALIRVLGEMGDKAAFDYLLYAGYVDYPEQVKAAAREAMNRLKW